MRALVLTLVLSLTASAQDVALLDGKPVVTESDLAAWSAAQACYGEGALTSRRAAFMRLTEAALAAEAMRRHGGPDVTDADVAKDAERIDRETQAPEVLACIKSVLGADYRRVFVRPSYTESRLRLFLMRDPGVQSGPRGKVLAAASHKGGLEAAARDLGLHYSSGAFSAENSTAAGRPGMPPPEYQADFIKRHLSGLTEGQVGAQPVETDYTFQAVRLIRRDGPLWVFESAVARKRGQEEWFKSLPKVRLEVRDAPLRDWVRSIKGNPRLAAVEVAP